MDLPTTATAVEGLLWFSNALKIRTSVAQNHEGRERKGTGLAVPKKQPEKMALDLPPNELKNRTSVAKATPLA